MFLTVFLILVLLCIAYVLVVPIVLFIDTSTSQYFIQIKGLFKCEIGTHEKELIIIKLKVLVFNFSFFPLKKNKEANKITKTEHRRRKKGKKRISFQTGLRMIQSFEIKKFRLDIDTGDYITNAKLYPLFTFLNYKTGGFNINFENRNQLLLQMHNRPIFIIKSFINL